MLSRVYIFQRVGSAWVPAGFIKAAGVDLGMSVSMGGTGTWLAVRASTRNYFLTQSPP